MFGKEEYVKKTEKHPFAFFPLSIDELAADVRGQQVVKLPKADYFALQLDESTDMSNDPVFSVCVVVYQNEMQEEFIFCKQLPGGKKSSEIFKVIDNFFREQDIPWPKCVAMCPGGARAMYDALHAWRMLLPKTCIMNSQTSYLP